MTAAAKHFGKDIYEFLRLPSTKDYIEALSSSGIFPGQEFVKATPGNRYITERGTWAHPKLAVFFARWLDVRLSVWCDSVIDELLGGKATVAPPAPSRRLPPWMTAGRRGLGSSSQGQKKPRQQPLRPQAGTEKPS